VAVGIVETGADDRGFQIVVVMCPPLICAGARVGERSALVDRGESGT
jgi:hypothetical protein